MVNSSPTRWDNSDLKTTVQMLNTVVFTTTFHVNCWKVIHGCYTMHLLWPSGDYGSDLSWGLQLEISHLLCPGEIKIHSELFCTLTMLSAEDIGNSLLSPIEARLGAKTMIGQATSKTELSWNSPWRSANSKYVL